MNEQKKWMHTIQRYSFAVTEAALYLDTHPNCLRALRYYEKYRQLYKEAVEKYEECFGPLTIYGNRSTDCWRWVEEAWPWEV